ncbi:Uncharacterised protein [Serratia fonticola]|uniref:hypothetical protein n=1 Tax=Serratia fonticola TaxID=47917 RepID=UPI00217AF4D6|nr:hypothetical protein [Serratia fonticola]CAI2036248.1 Uncharacterised protein [Serratia fonticola]
MSQTDSTFTPAVIIAIISIVITIVGWIVTALIAMSNNSRNLKKLEVNRLIDELFFKLDFIYNEMLNLAQDKNANKTMAYYIFIAAVRHIEFTCNRIMSLDGNKPSDSGLIAELRQVSTDDRKYESSKIGSTLAELQHVNEKIKSKYNKTF